MFDLSDDREKRRRVIAGYAEVDIRLGVILAAVDFEWTCRRTILALSKTPTVTLREKFTSDYASFSGLSKGWNAELASLSSIEDVFRPTRISWSQIADAMDVRNAIVHGSGDQIDRREGRYAVYILETACDALSDFALSHKKDLFRRISRPRKKEIIELETAEQKKRNDRIERIGAIAKKLGERHWVNQSQPWK